MSENKPSTVQPLRLNALDLKTRFETGEQVTVLDVRNATVWEASDRQIRGAVRLLPSQIRIDPSWPKERLTIAYCT